MPRRQRLALFTLFALLLALPAARAQDPLAPLYDALDALLEPVAARRAEPMVFRCDFEHQREGRSTREGHVELARRSDEAFRLLVRYHDTQVDIERTTDRCVLSLPEHKATFMDEGPLSDPDRSALTLSKLAMECRAVSPQLNLAAQMAQSGDSRTALFPLLLAGQMAFRTAGTDDRGARQFELVEDDDVVARLTVAADAPRLERVEVDIDDGRIVARPVLEWTTPKLDLAVDEVTEAHTVDRDELEHTLRRAVVRLIEIKEDQKRRALPDATRVGEHGVYQMRDGARVVVLRGDAREVGLQHGRFLADEARKTLESALYVAGLGYTIDKGEWFADRMREARRRLEPHIPEDYLAEEAGLAEGAGLPLDEVRLATVFPAMFHCSGFAVQGAATTDGTLYHGRVLDYMTGMGLEENAAVFVVAREGKIPFVNVGYAGFIGSVSGMNAEQVSLGEMGGGGVGQWDGVPMPILMRMALENAHTLDEAKAIFADNPRTCEYFYVFADGKDRSAVGVAAVPEEITFVNYGEAHPRLDKPVDDCVLLSAGGRYDALVEKVRAQYGQIGPGEARELMDRPVAMKGANLHNVLFVPEQLVFWVQDAGRNRPAYKHPWRRYSLRHLLSMAEPAATSNP